MSAITLENIKKELSVYTEKNSGFSLDKLISGFAEHEGKIFVSLNIDPKHLKSFEQIAKEAEHYISEKLNATLKISLSSEAKEKQAESKAQPIKGIKKVIMVTAGKGGVGKSTIAFSLALSLKNAGYKVGIADVDIYGPSLPKLSGIKNKPVLENNLMIPHKKFGIKLMSVGYLVNENDALIWRGPMTSKMLYQLLRLTDWTFDGEELDYLVLDTPPGTGDVHLSLMEQYKIDTSLVVTTPSVLAAADAAKCLSMLKKMNIHITGIVENMAYFEDENGNRSYIFGQGGGEKLAKEFETNVITQVPMSSELTNATEKAQVFTLFDEDTAYSKVITSIVRSLN